MGNFVVHDLDSEVLGNFVKINARVLFFWLKFSVM